MSLSLILKNIYSFLKVLEQAHCKHVALWDTRSLDHAYRWATYCEQIYEHARGKSYYAELDHQVTLMGSLPWSLGDTKVCLGLLHRATRHLTQTLIQNPFLSDELFESVTRLTTPESLLQDCWQISRSKAALQVGAAARKHVLPSSDSETTDRKETVIRSEAVVLVRYIDNILAGSELHTCRCEEVLRNKLNSLSLQPQGTSVIVTALALAPQTDTVSVKVPALTQDFLLHHLLHQPRQQLREMWKLPQELLCHVCARHVTIYTLYMRHLVALADTIPRHTPYAATAHQHIRCDPVVVPDLTSDTYATIQTCLTSLLLHAGKHVAMATRKTIQSLADSSEGTIWEQLLIDTTDCKLPE